MNPVELRTTGLETYEGRRSMYHLVQKDVSILEDFLSSKLWRLYKWWWRTKKRIKRVVM